jgi:TRAP-type C4-dicarboxylate transport system permease small subunit
MAVRQNTMIRFLNQLERVIIAITAGILGLLACVVGWQVVARYILQSGQFWVEEISLIGMMWAALLGAAACMWTDSHVRLEMVLSRFPPGLRKWVLTFTDGIVLWFCFLMFKEGIFLVQRTMGGEMSALRVPIGSTYIILPVSAVLMFLFVLARAIKRFGSPDREDGGLR